MYFCFANRNVIYLWNLMQKMMQRIAIILNSSGESLEMQWKYVAASKTTTNCIRWKWFNSFYLNSFAFHLNNYSVREAPLEMFYACAVFIFRPNVDIRCGRNHIVPFEADALASRWYNEFIHSIYHFARWCMYSDQEQASAMNCVLILYSLCRLENRTYLFVSGFLLFFSSFSHQENCLLFSR